MEYWRNRDFPSIIYICLSEKITLVQQLGRMITVNGITEMLKGVLEGMILEIINQHETYGYEITNNLQNMALKILLRERFIQFY